MDGCLSADTSPLFFSSGGGVSFLKFKVRVLTPIQVKCSNPNGSGGQAAPVYFWVTPEDQRLEHFGENNCHCVSGTSFLLWLLWRFNGERQECRHDNFELCLLAGNNPAHWYYLKGNNLTLQKKLSVFSLPHPSRYLKNIGLQVQIKLSA
jgi:hypothetical protein